MKRRFIVITAFLAISLAGCGQIDESTTSAKNNKENPSAARIEVQTDVRTEEEAAPEITSAEKQTTTANTSEYMTNNISTTEEFRMKSENENTIFEDNDMSETDTTVNVDIPETKSDDINNATIFDRLSSLNYIPITCDGLPEYKLTADDGTVYWLNFSNKWVWKDGIDAEAALPDDMIALLKENSNELYLEEAGI